MAKMNFKILPEKINVVKKFTRKTSLIFSRGHNDKEEIHIKNGKRGKHGLFNLFLKQSVGLRFPLV